MGTRIVPSVRSRFAGSAAADDAFGGLTSAAGAAQRATAVSGQESCMHTHRTARLFVPLTPPGASSLTRCSLKSRRFHRSCTCRCGSCHVAGRWSPDAHCRACSHLTRLASTAAVAALPVGRFWVEQRKQLAHLFLPGKLKRRDLLCSAWFVDVGRLSSSVRSSTPRAYWIRSIVQRAEAALTPNAQVPTRHPSPSEPATLCGA